jgi:energy-coupling factor transport system permease protein
MSVTVVTLLVSTTSNIELTYAISCLLMPFKVLKLPIMEWTMIISLALRFIPTLLSESERILYAQASRGVDFKNGNFRDKAVGLISLIIPMFLISFNKSNELANALDVRNFNTNNIRSQYRYFTVSPIDFIILLCVSVIFALTLFFSIFNVTFSLFSISDIVLKFMQS